MKRLIVDLRAAGQIAVGGDDREQFLQGMCTSDVLSLAEGESRKASILTAKGRLVSIVDIARRDDHHTIFCQADLRDPTIEFLDQYVMVDDVELTPADEPAYTVWAEPEDVWRAQPVFGEPPEPPASAEEVEIRRVEAGFPHFGVDVSDRNFPFETPLDRFIDYRKGCYIGQEPVARVASRGSPNKYLRGLRVEGEGAVSVGARVDHPERRAAARVTSSAVSPEFGSIALALMPRGAWEVGDRVEIEGRSAEVVALPFGTEEPC